MWYFYVWENKLDILRFIKNGQIYYDKMGDNETICLERIKTLLDWKKNTLCWVFDLHPAWWKNGEFYFQKSNCTTVRLGHENGEESIRPQKIGILSNFWVQRMYISPAWLLRIFVDWRSLTRFLRTGQNFSDSFEIFNGRSIFLCF